MDHVKYPVLDVSGKSSGDFELCPNLFDVSVNEDLVKRSLCNFLHNQRQGNASTKTRGEVSGSTKKPWKQKGTGKARVGTKTSPLLRGKGIIFGPHKKEYSMVLPRLMRQGAVSSLLTLYRKEGRFFVVRDLFDFGEYATKKAGLLMRGIFSGVSKMGRVLFVSVPAPAGEEVDSYRFLRLSCRNLSWLKFSHVDSLNIHDLMYFDKILFSNSALRSFHVKNGCSKVIL